MDAGVVRDVEQLKVPADRAIMCSSGTYTSRCATRSRCLPEILSTAGEWR
jgi:hypothetical protein